MARVSQAVSEDAFDDGLSPRSTYELVGHDQAENSFLQEFRRGKLPHAWLIAGPAGIGKATLAFRIARFLLQDKIDTNASNLFVDPNAQVSKLIANKSHSNLLVLSRPWDKDKKRFKTAVTIDEVRKIHDFFGLAAGRRGWRVCIVDTADDLNVSAANALLKTLEEPPANTIILLLAGTPGRLLPTIRSRCRLLRLEPLKEESVIELLRNADIEGLSGSQIPALARLSEGSIGQALRLADHNGLDLYGDILAILNTLPKLDELALEGFAAKVTKTAGDETFQLVCSLISDWLETLVINPDKPDILKGEGALRKRLLSASSPADWVDVWEEVRELEQICLGLHMDRKQTLYLAFQRIKGACAQS